MGFLVGFEHDNTLVLQIPFQEVFNPKNLPKIHSQKGLGALGTQSFIQIALFATCSKLVNESKAHSTATRKFADNAHLDKVQVSFQGTIIFFGGGCFSWMMPNLYMKKMLFHQTSMKKKLVVGYT